MLDTCLSRFASLKFHILPGRFIPAVTVTNMPALPQMPVIPRECVADNLSDKDKERFPVSTRKFYLVARAQATSNFNVKYATLCRYAMEGLGNL